MLFLVWRIVRLLMMLLEASSYVELVHIFFYMIHKANVDEKLAHVKEVNKNIPIHTYLNVRNSIEARILTHTNKYVHRGTYLL